MIVSWLLSGLFLIVDFILSLLNLVFPVLDSSFFTGITNYLQSIISNGSGLLFFIIPPDTFRLSIDILFFLYTAEPLYHFVIWVLRKIPFLGIN